MKKGLRDISNIDHNHFMRIAIKEAEMAGQCGDRPIAAIIVHNNHIIAKGSSKWRTGRSDVHHAENTAIMSCAPYLQEYGRECLIYSTVEPCIMCISTIAFSDIRNVIFAIEDKHMNTYAQIKAVPYLKERIFNYISGICVEEALQVFKRYTIESELNLVLNGC